jgi:hypothetical protein
VDQEFVTIRGLRSDNPTVEATVEVTLNGLQKATLAKQVNL